MERLVRVRNEFDAHHRIVDQEATPRPRCSRDHGHHWVVEVTKSGRDDGLEDDAAAVLSELADRSVNDMFPGLAATPEALSGMVMERLILRHPTIIEVSVSDGRLTGITRNTPR